MLPLKVIVRIIHNTSVSSAFQSLRISVAIISLNKIYFFLNRILIKYKGSFS